MKNNPKVSIIVPAYNEEDDISKCIDSVLKQSHKNYELIIVDDGSTDSTREIVKAYKNKKIKLIQGEHKGPGFSRNLGSKKAKGEILVFIDADMILDKSYIKNLIKPIISGETIGTEDGYQLASNPKNIWSRCWGQYAKSPEFAKSNYKNEKYLKGYIFRAILRSEFNKLGGFNPSLGYADDLTFYLRDKKTSLRVKNAFCHHKNPETFKQVFKQSRWIGASLPATRIKSKISQYLTPISMFVLSPIAIPLLTIRKCYLNKDFTTILPWMPLFITARYFGTLVGLFNAVYRNKNTR